MDAELDLDTLNALTDEQVLDAGLAAIERELGLLGMIRFMQIVRPGTGDYSKERHALLDHLPREYWLSPHTPPEPEAEVGIEKRAAS